MRRYIYIYIIGTFGVPAWAQTASPSASSAVATPATPAAQWLTLQALGGPKNLTWPAHSNAAAVQQAKASAIAAYVSDADQLNQFYTKNPTDANAGEARRREALSLLYAEQLGDTADATRTGQVVTAVRQDTALPAGEREQVAALSDNLAVSARPSLALDDRLLAFEQVARGLIAEFPTVSAGAESLVQVAKASSDARAAIIAHDVLALPVSDTLKTQAQTILRRQALIGRSLSGIATGALGAASPIPTNPGNVVCVYSWSASVPSSLALARQLATAAPSGAVLVGVCVDLGDLTKARATGAQLPGNQVYDALGYAGRLAGRLELSEPGHVYLTDAKGVLRSISAQRNLTAAFAALSNP